MLDEGICIACEGVPEFDKALVVQVFAKGRSA